MANKIYKGDIGTEILLDTGTNILAASTHDIKYEKPDNTVGTWTATIKDTTKVSYIIQSDDLDQIGEYEVQDYHGTTII